MARSRFNKPNHCRQSQDYYAKFILPRTRIWSAERQLKNIARCFNPDGYGAIVNSSRGIIYAHTLSPWKEKYGVGQWECAVEEAIIKMNKELKEVTWKIKGKT